ncbi:hypothetical protein SS17_1464 [Escherichia coli O157:H7 str. SS17]|nr:hypothetical protein SS17_1464 [Escherichia coli O157:H7 str. SS17]
MTKVRDIAPYSVRMPDSLKRDLTIRASKNGRSLNSEIVMILQAAIDEEKSPRSIEGFAQQESEKFREALLKTLSSMYGEDKKPPDGGIIHYCESLLMERKPPKLATMPRISHPRMHLLHLSLRISVVGLSNSSATAGP